uniref:Uncharacterized protein n=1 Tax=viral metagenome TaxID=1070528 RepID=A0A6M3JWX9_9ZZZZ
MKMNDVQTGYKIGYTDGFGDGMKAAKKCLDCEYSPHCDTDSDQKIDYCPNVVVREYWFTQL